MRLLPHPDALQQRYGRLVSWIDGREDAMLSERSEEVVKQSLDRLGREAPALVSWSYGEANLDLARMVSREVHTEIADEQVRLPEANGQLKPGTRRVEGDGLQTVDEMERVVDRAWRPRLILANLGVGAVLEKDGGVAAKEWSQFQALGDDLWSCQDAPPSCRPDLYPHTCSNIRIQFPPRWLDQVVRNLLFPASSRCVGESWQLALVSRPQPWLQHPPLSAHAEDHLDAGR